MNPHPTAHTKTIEKHGPRFGKIIIKYLTQHNKKYYRNKHITKNTHLHTQQVTIGTIWLHNHGYVTQHTAHLSLWEHTGRPL